MDLQLKKQNNKNLAQVFHFSPKDTENHLYCNRYFLQNSDFTISWEIDLHITICTWKRKGSGCKIQLFYVVAYITAVVFTFVFSEYSPSSLSRYINREKRERGPSKWDIVRSSVLLTFVSRKFLSTSEFTIAYKKNFLVPQKHNSNITDIHGIFKL